ncbi:MAG: DUF2784 family protein [Bdellovibrionales bacterium]|nr:DUF2784 family protein [Bdellovibrionales bacterium]
MYWIIACLRLLHFLVLLFIVGGCLYPSVLVWQVHLIFVPLVIIQWFINKDRCVFTNLEIWLRKRANMDPMIAAEPGIFIKSVLSICLTPLPEEKVILWITYGSMILSCSISMLRLMIS